MTRKFTSSVLDSYSRGTEFGAAHSHQVRETISAYESLFMLRGVECGVDGETVREIAEDVGLGALRQVDAWAPELGQEIRGIADGADLPLAAVATINARTEVLAAVKQATAAGAGAAGGVDLAGGPGLSGRGECSTVVALGPEGAEPVAMQNWDWYLSLAGGWLVWEIPHPDGSTTTTATEYGIVGKIGFGRYGLGVLFNILGHERDGMGEPGVPVHVVARQVMDTAASVDEALTLMRTARVSASTVLTLVNGAGGGKAAVCAELWPGGVDVIEPHNGLLFHTNHFLGDGPRAGDTHLEIIPDTLTRLEALQRQLEPLGGAADAEQVRHALCDHGEGPNSVCCHPDPADPEGARYATLLTAAINFTDSTLDVSAGTPCEHHRLGDAVAATA